MTGGTERSIAAIVANDLCVGCGLCEALTGGRVKMVMTPAGSLSLDPPLARGCGGWGVRGNASLTWENGRV